MDAPGYLLAVGRIGADPEQLESLAAELGRFADAFQSGGGRIDRSIQDASWWGPDARRFRSQWQAGRGALRSAADSLQAAARQLRSDAAQQRSASEGALGGLIGKVHPLNTDRWTLEAAAGVGIGAAFEGELIIDDLPGPQSRVTITVDHSLGGGLGLGGGTEIHGEGSLGAEGHVDVDGAVVGTSSSTWLVPDEEALDFGRARAAEAAVDQVPVLSAIRPAVQSLTGHPTPPPATTTELVGVSWAVTAAGTLGTGSGDAGETNTAQIGRRRRGETVTQVLHLQGSGAATIPGLLFGGGAPRSDGYAIDSEIELFPAKGDKRTILITTTSVDGDEAVRVVSRAVVDQSTAGAALDHAWRQLGLGDLTGALDTLGDLPEAIESVEMSTIAGEVHSDTWGAGTTAGDGARSHFGGEVVHESVTWGGASPTGGPDGSA
jgi:uncharacterized protein YukE